MRILDYMRGEVRNSKYSCGRSILQMIIHLLYGYDDTRKEDGRHGSYKRWLIILAEKLERPTLVTEDNNN